MTASPEIRMATLKLLAALDQSISATASYRRANGILLGSVEAFAGIGGFVWIADCGNKRFEFVDEGSRDAMRAYAFEALDEDGETTLDLVAYEIERPGNVFTMFGRASILNAWAAFNPASYYLGKALRIYRTPLGWLQAGCEGAMCPVISDALTGRVLNEIDGLIQPEDEKHAQAIAALKLSAVELRNIVVAAE